MRVLDPTFEETAVGFAQPPRLEDLRGTTIGIISNGKEGTAHLFAHLERVLRGRFGVATVVQRVKGNLSAPAEREIMDEAAAGTPRSRGSATEEAARRAVCTTRSPPNAWGFRPSAS